MIETINGVCWEFSVENKNVTIDGLVGRDYTQVEVPSEISGCPVVSIGSAFSYCTSLESVTIPNSVTSIGESAFSRCSSLTSVTIPDGVTSIGKYAFNHCDSLASVVIPDSVTNIGHGAFSECKSLTNVTMGEGIMGIEVDVFKDCKNLRRVAFKNRPEIHTDCFHRQAFDGCSDFNEVHISSLERWCQSFCGELGFLMLLDAGRRLTMNRKIYSDAGQIVDLVIPEGVTAIGVGAFYGCVGLRSVTIPDSVTSICEYAFCGCQSLTCVRVGNGVVEIGDHAFEGCDLLMDVLLGNSVKDIMRCAFNKCSSLTSITLPSSIKCIEWQACANCRNLLNVNFLGELPTIWEGAFDNCGEKMNVRIVNLDNNTKSDFSQDVIQYEYIPDDCDDEGCDMNFPPDWAEESGWNDMYGGGCDPSDFIDYD